MLHIGQTNKSERRRVSFPFPEFHKTHTHFLQWQPRGSAERKACGKTFPEGMRERDGDRGGRDASAVFKSWWEMAVFRQQFSNTHSQRDRWVVVLPVLSQHLKGWAPGRCSPIITNKQTKKRIPIFIPCTTCDSPQRGSTDSGLLGFPADMLSLKKARK